MDSPFIAQPTSVPPFHPGAPIPRWLQMALTCPGIDPVMVDRARQNITPYLHLRGLRAEVVRCLAYPQDFGVPWDGRWVEVAVLQGLLTDEQAARLVGYAVGCLWQEDKPTRALPLGVLSLWTQHEEDLDAGYTDACHRDLVVGGWDTHHILWDCGESQEDQILIGTTFTEAIYDQSRPPRRVINSDGTPMEFEEVLIESVGCSTFADGTKHLEVKACREHLDRIAFSYGAVFWEQITTEDDEKLLADIRAGKRRY